MGTVKYLFIVLFAAVIFITPTSALTPTGCEWYNSTVLKCWNNGTIQNTTYFNKDTFQMANYLDRFDWAQYGFGIMVRALNTDVSNLSLNFSFVTDNATFYYLNWSSTRSLNGYVLYYTYTARQNLSSDYVNFTFTVGRTSGLIGTIPVTLYNKVKNINISYDGNDVINFQNNGTALGFYLNGSSINYTMPSYPRVQFGEMETTDSIQFLYKANLSRVEIINNTPYQNTVVLKKNFNLSMTNGTLEYSFEWIDVDPCTYVSNPTCFGISIPYLVCKDTGSTTTCTARTDTNRIGIYARFTASSSGSPPCSYNFNRGCYWEIRNSSTGLILPYRGVVTMNVSCYNPTHPNCLQDAIYNATVFVYYTSVLNITCYQPVVRGVYGNLTIPGLANLITGTFTLQCNTDTTKPDIYYYPPNNTILGIPTYVWFNASDTSPLKNMSIWSNVSGTNARLAAVFPLPELTYNLSTLAINISSGKYYYYIFEAYDTQLNVNRTGAVNMTIETFRPNVSITNPLNNTNISNMTLTTINCTVEDDRSAIANISLWTNFTGTWAVNRTLGVLRCTYSELLDECTAPWTNDSLTQNVSFSVNITIPGYYNIQCRACDAVGNCNNTGTNVSIRVTTCNYPKTLATSWTLIQNEVCINEFFTLYGNLSLNNFNLTFINSNMSINLRQNWVYISPLSRFYLNPISSFGDLRSG